MEKSRCWFHLIKGAKQDFVMITKNSKMFMVTALSSITSQVCCGQQFVLSVIKCRIRDEVNESVSKIWCCGIICLPFAHFLWLWWCRWHGLLLLQTGWCSQDGGVPHGCCAKQVSCPLSCFSSPMACVCGWTIFWRVLCSQTPCDFSSTGFLLLCWLCPWLLALRLLRDQGWLYWLSCFWSVLFEAVFEVVVF